MDSVISIDFAGVGSATITLYSSSAYVWLELCLLVFVQYVCLIVAVPALTPFTVAVVPLLESVTKSEPLTISQFE